MPKPVKGQYWWTDDGDVVLITDRTPGHGDGFVVVYYSGNEQDFDLQISKLVRKIPVPQALRKEAKHATE